MNDLKKDIETDLHLARQNSKRNHIFILATKDKINQIKKLGYKVESTKNGYKISR